MTTTKTIWEMLGQIPVGTIFAWGAVTVTIVTVIVKGVMKLYDYFSKIRKLKEENEKLASMVKEHDETLKQINEALSEIKQALQDQSEYDLKQIRHTIIMSCYEALTAGEIQFEKHKSLEEMFEEYTEKFHGNGYVADLMERVKNVPIVGSPDGQAHIG
ncbi:MAG: hypothetical protein IJ646_06180 [Clostridia bacterium]|nr:hypothetical protein [Clostridia bacterium]